MNRLHPVVRLALWTTFLAVTLRLLHGSTMGTLSVPAGSLDALGAWVDRTSPAVMAVSLVRLVALVGGWYLAIVTMATVVADIAGWDGLARLVAAASPAVVRRIATRSAGAGLVAGALVAAVPLPAPLDTAPSLDPPSGLAIRPAGAVPSSASEGAPTDLNSNDTLATPVVGSTRPTATMVRLPSVNLGPTLATMSRDSGPDLTSQQPELPQGPPEPPAAAGPSATMTRTPTVPLARPPRARSSTPTTTTMTRAGEGVEGATTPDPPSEGSEGSGVPAPASSHIPVATMRRTEPDSPTTTETTDAATEPPASRVPPQAAAARPSTATMTYGEGDPPAVASAAQPTVRPADGRVRPAPSHPRTATMTYSADDRPSDTDRSRSASGESAGALDRRAPADQPTTSTAGRSTDQLPASQRRPDPDHPTSEGSPGPSEVSDDAARPSSPARDRRHDHLAGSARPTRDVWVVEQGDSFWSVAAETLADRAGVARDAPDDGEVERYWRLLVDTNRPGMPDPTNPDLLIPGQELTLPPS